MRLEAEFISKDNKLFTADGKPVAVDIMMRAEAAMICGRELEPGARKKMISELAASNYRPLCVYLPWFLVEAAPENYNEAVLASLRDFLIEIEQSGLHAVIVPQPDEDSSPVPIARSGTLVPEAVELFIAAMKHTARRIKDCRSVIGFAVPPVLLAEGVGEGSACSRYITELSEKHEQYLFFVKSADAEKAGCLDNMGETNIVLY